MKKKITEQMLKLEAGRVITGLKPNTGGRTPKGCPVMSVDELYRLYIENCKVDPTEYSLAQEVAESWSVWKRFKENCPDLRKRIVEWAEEANVARQSEAWKRLNEQAEKNTTVAKYLAEHTWKGGITRQVRQEKKPPKESRDNDTLELPKELVEAIKERTNGED